MHLWASALLYSIAVFIVVSKLNLFNKEFWLI